MVVIQARILQESASYRYSNKSVKRVPARCLRGKTVHRLTGAFAKIRQFQAELPQPLDFSGTDGKCGVAVRTCCLLH
jgi:hypothetical protein